MDNVAFELILYSGNSKSSAMEALRFARKNKFKEAKEKLKEAQEQLTLAHEIQTHLLVKQANGANSNVDILMVHAQDHLNAALTTLDLVSEMVGILEDRREDQCE